MPHILSNSIILKTPKIYFFDPCLAVAALKTNSKDILEDTSKFLLYNYSNRLDSGFFFESQVLKQFRTFIECLNGNMYYYRDSADIEVDAVVEIDNNIAIFEIKVGGGESVLKGVKSLNKFRSILTDEEKSKITSYNIITCAGYSVYDVKNDINIISIDDLFLEQ
jgi:predicted AAA+ superfamily ATPase